VHKLTLEQLTESFLDQVAECFDNSLAVWHGTPFLDPRDGQPIDAGQLLERIRLGKDAKEPNRG
jgi:hypothetical protein